jgi:hypothetical protein
LAKGGPLIEFEEVEQEIAAAVRETAEWSTAVKARSVLCELVAEMANSHELHLAGDASDIDARLANQTATVKLAAIAIQAMASGLSQVSNGYAWEAKTSARRLDEAYLRIRAIADDQSGEQARAWLCGRPIVSTERLRRRYWSVNPAAMLSTAAHADVDGLLGQLTDSGAESLWILGPRTHLKAASAMCTLFASQAVMICGHLFEAFRPRLSDSSVYADNYVELLEVQIALGHTHPIVRPGPPA